MATICAEWMTVINLHIHIRDEWTNREKLAFPICIDMIDGLHLLYPSIPRIKVRFIGDLHEFIKSLPFDDIGWKFTDSLP